MSDSEEGDILFLQLPVMFKKKEKNERKKNIGCRNFWTKVKKRSSQQFNKT